MCEWQTVLGIMLNPERSMKLRTITQNTFIVRSLTAQRVRLSSKGLPACIDQWRNNGSIQWTGQCRYGNPIQLYTTAHYYGAVYTQRFLGYDDTLRIQVILCLHRISTYFTASRYASAVYTMALCLSVCPYWDGWLSSGRYIIISICNQPTTSTQPCVAPGSLNGVPALPAVRAGWRDVTSAGWQVTLCDPVWCVSSRSGEASCKLLYSIPYLTCWRHSSTYRHAEPVACTEPLPPSCKN